MSEAAATSLRPSTRPSTRSSTRPSTRPSTRSFIAACAAAIAYPLGYALPILFAAPSFYYDPLARRFFVGERTGPLPMGYFGQIAWGASLGIAAGLAAWWLCGKLRHEPKPKTLTLLGGWAMSALVLVGIYFTWTNWP